MSASNSALGEPRLEHRKSQSMLANWMELLGSMRFAISLLTLICVASAIGTMVRQNEPWVNYVNQFGPFWAGFFQSLGLFKIYNAPWFIAVMAFLVTSTSLCVWRNAPKMIREMRVYRENIREGSLNAFAHRWQGTFSQSPGTLPDTITEWLKFKGYRVRLSKRDGGTMVAAKAGSLNRLGYVFTHVAIIVICIGGLLDSGVPLKVAIWALDKKPVQGGFISNQIPQESRLGVSNPSYRANLLLPEGQSSRVAVLNTDNGLLIQDLPFSLTLKKFRIDFYSTGMPRLFASDVEVFDPERNKRFDATIEVNKPLVYRGVTIYQSSFDDGGTQVKLNAIPLSGTGTTAGSLNGVIGDTLPLKGFDDRYSLELTGFKSINVESMPVNNSDKEASAKDGGNPAPVALSDDMKAFEKNLASVVGPGVKRDQKNRFTNIGPSVTYKLRDKAGQAKEFKTYMLPVSLDGAQYYLAGMRDTPADNFQYLRIPVDEDGQITGFMRLRAALQDPALRRQAAERFAAQAFGQKGDSPDLRAKVADSASKALDRFAGVDGQPGGLAAIASFIDKTVPEKDRETAGSVLIRLIQGSMWELYQISREKAGLPDVAANAFEGRFVQDAQLGLSDIAFFGAPVLLEMDQFNEVKASVFQVAKAPGQWVVYAGCLLLVIGVFSMFYIRERRLFFWVTPEGQGSKVWMGMSTTRKTMDFENEYQRIVKELDERADGVDEGKSGGKQE
ncbi:cytochrome c biogenesis protein ResB [Limnobacter litoralis]|uniref:Cytochrome c biogenesis protein n=1 Tax=Limnobacter litoralis TaxID=481366 RepID=A0ABQ5YT30_9BURK|nr:cytochrome c biogenesis protein ResB [Limnobacter litoralis]GLR25592.1 cytochrome c biogenesis protein [Limnobacter litoralis]